MIYKSLIRWLLQPIIWRLEQITIVHRKKINSVLLVIYTSSKAQSLGWSLLSPPLGDHINPSIMPVNLFILSPKTANSLHPLCPFIISSILQERQTCWKQTQYWPQASFCHQNGGIKVAALITIRVPFYFVPNSSQCI